MGQASKFASSFGSHLASGALDVAREKVGGMTSTFSAKASETTGGKIAEAIAERASANGSGSDEVSQFVNQNAAGDSQ